MKKKININEAFYTLQGEGKYLGTPSMFIRTNGCNMRCQWKNLDGSFTKCDTPYTSWEQEQIKPLTIEEVINIVDDKKKKYLGLEHIVITGGEPFLQPHLPELIEGLKNKGYKITVETNGTLYKPTKADLISLSPKLNSSTPRGVKETPIHQKAQLRYRDSIKQFLSDDNDLAFKFVYNNNISEINKFVNHFGIDRRTVYLMPQGITKKQLQLKQQELFSLCMREGYNYTPRMHVDVFGDKRGV